MGQNCIALLNLKKILIFPEISDERSKNWGIGRTTINGRLVN